MRTNFTKEETFAMRNTDNQLGIEMHFANAGTYVEDSDKYYFLLNKYDVMEIVDILSNLGYKVMELSKLEHDVDVYYNDGSVTKGENYYKLVMRYL